MRNSTHNATIFLRCSMLQLPAVVIACSLLLVGCTKPDEKTQAKNATSSTADSAFVASAKGRIDIEGGVVKLAARRDGIVQKVLVEEGESVKSGQLLAVLDDEQARLSANLADAETEQARRALPILAIRLAATRREEARLAPLAPDQLVTKQEMDQARDQVKLVQAEISASEAALQVASRRLEVARYEIEQRTVRAPLDGQIVRRQARPGDGVSTLNVTPMFVFAPDAPRIVRAELEERFLTAVKPGQSAQVVIEADERQVFRAKVIRLARVVGMRSPSDDPGEKQDARVAECVLSIDAPNLLIGQRVIVRFSAEQ
jgi:HlyD family secretion protein